MGPRRERARHAPGSIRPRQSGAQGGARRRRPAQPRGAQGGQGEAPQGRPPRRGRAPRLRARPRRLSPLALDAIPRQILEIVLDQRWVSDETIAPQVNPAWKEDDVCRLTAKLRRQGLIAEVAYASDRWTITDEARAARPA